MTQTTYPTKQMSHNQICPNPVRSTRPNASHTIQLWLPKSDTCVIANKHNSHSQFVFFKVSLSHSVLNSKCEIVVYIAQWQPPAKISADRSKNPSLTLADKYTVRKIVTSDSKVPGEQGDVYSWLRCRLNRIIPKRRQVGVTHRVCQVGLEHKISK